MKFLNRQDELERLTELSRRGAGGLAVVVGRRRIGKTRLLLEWARRSEGLYAVADESAPDVQRRYVAQAIAARFPGFADVEYPDWASLLQRLAREARGARWRGPFILDELPYLAATSPELASVLQRWVDHEAKDARLSLAIAGSSQRMMQGLVLAQNAPLFGRAGVLLELGPLDPTFLSDALGDLTPSALVEAYAAWGGVPRYWELAAETVGTMAERLERLVLDPLGPLHREPERLLQEEPSPALEVRPVLDAIGMGAHRVSEIAGRLSRPATSMARPLTRLQGLGLVRRDVPFGESEKQSKRALYRIDDPLVRLWFRVVAPHRAALTSGGRSERLRLLAACFPDLLSQAWEDLCRLRIPRAKAASRLVAGSAWGPCARWWQGESPEWDLVSESLDRSMLLLGEAKWHAGPMSAPALARALAEVRLKPEPVLPSRFDRHVRTRALLVPELAPGLQAPDDVSVFTARDLIGRAASHGRGGSL